MTAAMKADIPNKVVFRLNGYGTVRMYDQKIDNPDLIRECLAVQTDIWMELWVRKLT